MYRRITNRVIAVVVTVLLVAATAVPAWAAPPADPNPTARINATITNITNITNWVTGILIGIATLFLTVGGLRRMTAGGDPAEIEKSNSAFKNTTARAPDHSSDRQSTERWTPGIPYRSSSPDARRPSRRIMSHLATQRRRPAADPVSIRCPQGWGGWSTPLVDSPVCWPVKPPAQTRQGTAGPVPPSANQHRR
ncbi:pilin [Dactylosporangium sp. NPDC049525]|uniref:pilin n=1 Tax=Dactylosporangium sp. NPDC049525 TaxID=3154730 RepID=UPI003422CAEA